MSWGHRLDRKPPIVGVGHGVQDWMGQVAARVESPLTLLREHLDALRALLRGERITTWGRYVSLDDVAPDWPPAPDGDTGVLAGATVPRTLRLSGEAADGTILHAGTAPDGVRRARELIDAGRESAGRTDPHKLVVYLLTATGADTVILQPTGDEPDPEGFVRFVTEEVRPLVP